MRNLNYHTDLTAHSLQTAHRLAVSCAHTAEQHYPNTSLALATPGHIWSHLQSLLSLHLTFPLPGIPFHQVFFFLPKNKNKNKNPFNAPLKTVHVPIFFLVPRILRILILLRIINYFCLHPLQTVFHCLPPVFSTRE